MFPIAEVILDDALDKPLDYAIPKGVILSPGMRVKVPVRTSLRQGTILLLKETSPFAKLQEIQEVLSDAPYISSELFKLAAWVAHYYATPLRKVLKTLLPSSIRGKARTKEQLWIKSAHSANALVTLCEELRLKSPKQAEVLDVLLSAPKGILLSALLEKEGISRSPIDTLIKKGILTAQKTAIDRSPLHDAEYFPTKPKQLNSEQEEALHPILKSLNENRFEVRLLHGVTGSGKTEVYLQAIDHALKLGKGILFLVPEIALTSQTIERMKSRFQEKIAVLHYRLSHGERHDTWHQIRTGKAPIVLGARSAVFSPIPNLGLILIDEEQEGSYKQSEESPLYHARDVAIMRGKICNATVLLGSATPSLESYHNTKIGKYALSCLKNRADKAHMPTVTLVDMRAEFAKAKGFTLFSEPLIDAMKKRVEVGEQTLLFLNRRGYHTSQNCTACGHTLKCPHCEISLTYHLGRNLLACHLCDYHLAPPPRTCPACHSEEGLKFKGAGTEMVERALHALLPEARTLRLDADTTRHKGSHEQLFQQFRSGKADILIGTQMIAKGLHFPAVTLVGVLHADSSLQIPDFRASEMVFQLLTQVAGRAGRGSIAGEVLIQTHLPDHSVIALAKEQDYEGFYAQEIEIRKAFHYPPFTHLVKLTFSGQDQKQTVSLAESIRSMLIQKLPPTFELLPIVPCGYEKIKGQFRFQLLIKGEKIGPLLSVLQSLPQGGSPRIAIDVDPLSTFF
ncbi:MAG: primosomal protein N' [Verrucomicrobia bacterium]|nr:primosomal protein N' [Verrucomicrobiota bacterium]